MDEKKRKANELLRIRVKKHRIRGQFNFALGGNEGNDIISSDSDEFDTHDPVSDEPDNDPGEAFLNDFAENVLNESDEGREGLDNNTDSEDESVDVQNNETESDSDIDSASELEVDFNEIDEEEADFFIEDDAEPEVKQLREWAIEESIKQNQLDRLLKILRSRLLPNLPKSSKTFLGTSGAKYNIIQMEDANGTMGEFVYFGIESGLKECVNLRNHENNLLELQISCDGLRLVDAGYQELWPLVGKIHFNPDIYEPFAIAVYFGETKPKSAEAYTDMFIEEINALQANGINIGGKHFNVKIKCFICDTPARAFLKCTIGHTGFNACERCTVQGFKEDATTVYPSIDSTERTDESFRARSQAAHHKSETPLINIRPLLNIIFCFILDFMHLCCQGIMKRLLEGWIVKGRNKLSRIQRLELSRRMKLLKPQIPCEFQRKTRSTNSIAKWKATEFRFFLLYCGPVVLIKILNKHLYKHFVLLHAACRILCYEKLCNRYYHKAKEYLRVFFKSMGQLYGIKSQVLNSHHLIHLADDVQHMGCNLTKVTAFPFENFLGKLKKYIRTPNKPLSQLCRRLHERKFISKTKASIPPLIQILNENRNGINSIMFKQSTITNKTPNNTILLNDDTVLEVKTITKTVENCILIKGEILEKKKPIFIYPFNSAYLKMWQLKTERTGNEKIINLRSIKCKLVKLFINFKEEDPLKEYVMPLLHS